MRQIHCQLGGKEFAAQQHLIANNQQFDRAGELPRQRQAAFKLAPVLAGVRRQPDAQFDAHPEALRNRRQRIQTLTQSVGSNAIGAGFEYPQVFLDLCRRDQGCGVERIDVGPAERRIGHARQGLSGGTRLLQIKRASALPPPAQNQCQHQALNQQGLPKSGSGKL